MKSKNDLLEIEINKSKVKQENTNHSKLTKEQESILNIISDNDEITEPDITSKVNLKPQLTNYHLGELMKMKLINAQYFSGSFFDDAPPTRYYVLQEGRKYLVENGLLK